MQFGGRAIDEFADAEIEDAVLLIQRAVPLPVFVADDAGNCLPLKVFGRQLLREFFPPSLVVSAQSQPDRPSWGDRSSRRASSSVR